MAEHAHTTPITLARRRHARAAPGAMDRRSPIPPTIVRVQLPRTESDGLPLVIDWRDGFATLPGHPALPLAFDWTGVITPALRRRVERDVELLIALLDALDAPGEDLDDGTEDMEEDNEDRCEAGDDDPASSRPHVESGLRDVGEEEDAEDNGDLEMTPEDSGEEQIDDMPHRVGGVVVSGVYGLHPVFLRSVP